MRYMIIFFLIVGSLASFIFSFFMFMTIMKDFDPVVYAEGTTFTPEFMELLPWLWFIAAVCLSFIGVVIVSDSKYWLRKKEHEEIIQSYREAVQETKKAENLYRQQAVELSRLMVLYDTKYLESLNKDKE